MHVIAKVLLKNHFVIDYVTSKLKLKKFLSLIYDILLF